MPALEISVIALVFTVLGVILLGSLALLYINKFQKSLIRFRLESEKKERELKKRVLELQVLKSLTERVGYSLDLQIILETIISSLGGMVRFATISYMTFGLEGKLIFRCLAARPVTKSFLDQVRTQTLSSFTKLHNKTYQPTLVVDKITGDINSSDKEMKLESTYSLPIKINDSVAAILNVSNFQKDLYKEEDIQSLNTIIEQVSEHATKLSQVVENEKGRLLSMVSSITDGIIMVDPSFNILVANPAVRVLLGLTEVTMVTLQTALANKVDLHKVILQAWTDQKVLSLGEIEVNQKFIQMAVEPVRDAGGSPIGVVVILHDVTEEKHLQKLREEFTSMMVHELRTPLTAITYSTSDLLSSNGKIQPDYLQKNLNIINSTTSQMLELVNELLDVAKIEAGKFQIVKQSNDLKSLIEERVATLLPIANKKNIQLQAEFGTLIPVFPFDRTRIGQVVTNLLSNAIKYTDSGEVRIITSLNEGHAQISVVDTGEGIRPEDLSKLFSKFEQLGKGKTGEKVGTGLGLVIARGIVEAHGGTVTVESKGQGLGTTFVFTLPLKGY
ncbi:MAG: HAMP domain-containing sensor histidine kinase [Candidatus Daviesbacteria bacterium]|nr:HAMP domain-containing sensor histidine kinase [Candidatus Daviesbacteria bacterium]